MGDGQNYTLAYPDYMVLQSPFDPGLQFGTPGAGMDGIYSAAQEVQEGNGLGVGSQPGGPVG
ncbi:MAG: hypothetical protein KIT09_23755 [Bryobacteraceae bacterium]|nr:hypothetical protein [Bryobacteraceae bacterium]